MPQNSIEGVGLGLRAQHFQTIIDTKPTVPWFEILSDNYLGKGGANLAYIDAIRADYPMTMHGVGLSIGSTDPINFDYLQQVKQLAERLQPVYISDHFCWISNNQQYLHDLMPLPFTEENIDHMVGRIQQVQTFLGRPLLFENLSSYLTYQQDQMPEWQFLNEVCKRSGCYWLLDVNNVYVSAFNHGFDAYDYIDHVDRQYIKEIHLAGYTDRGHYLYDTHSQPVHAPVWDLYQYAIKKLGDIPTLIEWDADIPEFDVLLHQAQIAKRIFP